MLYDFDDFKWERKDKRIALYRSAFYGEEFGDVSKTKLPSFGLAL